MMGPLPATWPTITRASTRSTLLTSLRAFPDVSVNPHVDSDLVEGAARRALVRAGYAFEDFEV